ncbi:MAG: uracil-DNA glycosylase, partial [Candidatus Heimdallarchaeota archaeon]|nr:uracil-DNA glycosylase [Candidatus Heimdallarchaeota archaeon]
DDKLADLTSEIKNCEACHLKENRVQVVPGIYGLKDSLCFIGEAPGFYEDRDGVPFVGRSGKLLDKMLDSIGFSRKNVNILNVVKCRPTDENKDNRTPKESELRFCGDKWLFKQLTFLTPKLIVTLGGISLKFFFPTAKVTKSAGNILTLEEGYPVFATFHPAYILRNYNKIEEYGGHFQKITEIYNQTNGEKSRKKSKRSEQKSLTDFI